MIEYGTTKYYQSQIDKARLQKELLELAINIRNDNAEIKVSEFETYGEILAAAERRIEWAKYDLKRHLERVENKQ